MKHGIGPGDLYGAAFNVGEARPVDACGPVGRAFVPFEAAWLDRPLFEIFAEVAAHHPERDALSDALITLTYGETLRQARELAGAIAAAVPRGEPVALALANTVAGPVAMLAALASGRPYLPVDLDAPEQRNAEILGFAGARAVIVDVASAAMAARIAPQLRQIRVDLPAEGGAASPQPTAPDEIATIFFTSGSTGRPKGIAHNGRFLAHSAMTHINGLHISAEDRLTQLFSPAVQRASQATFSTLLTGATLDIVELRKQGLQGITRAASERGVTILDTLPALFRRLLSLGVQPETFASLRLVVLAGERVFASDVALFKQHLPRGSLLYCHLGSSETDKYANCFVGHDTPVPDGMLPAGFPLPDTQVSLRDEAGREVAPGEAGEIVLTGRYLATGYWKEPALTEATFSVAPDDPHLKTFRIGDVGRFLPDGRLEYLGRKDRMVKVRGNRVELAEVEAALRTHPSVIDGAVIARPVEDDIAIIAYVLCRTNDGAEPWEPIAQWLATRLPAPMQPQEVHELAELPTLPNQKPDLLALEALDRARAAAKASAKKPVSPVPAPLAARAAGTASGAAVPAKAVAEKAPAADIEALARQVWTQLLPAESWEADRPWGASGGDSLKAMELVLHLEKLLGRRIPVHVLLPQTTPKVLVDGLKTVLNRSAPVAAAGDAPLLFLLPGAAGPFMDMALFAEDLAPGVDVRILDYPSFDPKAPRIITVAETLERVRNEIAQAAPNGPLRMLGYSYGGYLATQLAQDFLAAGREVALLGLIDCTPLPMMAKRAHIKVEDGEEHLKEQVGRMGGRPETGTELSWSRWVLYSLAVAGINLASWLIRCGWLGTLSQIVRGIGRLGFSRTEAMLWWSLAYLNNRSALAEFLPPRFPGEIWLFRVKDDSGRPLPEDYLWRSYCESLRIAVIEGAHNTIFTPANTPALRQAVLAAIKPPAAVAAPSTVHA